VVAVLAIEANLIPPWVAAAEDQNCFESVVAFFSGFSERFARDMLASAPPQTAVYVTARQESSHSLTGTNRAKKLE